MKQVPMKTLLIVGLVFSFWHPMYSQIRYTVIDLGLSRVGTSMNDLGHVVGRQTISGQVHGFIWKNGVTADLGVLTFPNDINNKDQVVGVSRLTPSVETASLWQNDSVVILGTLTGGAQSRANRINDSGQVVGWSQTSSGSALFLWQHGVMTGLPITEDPEADGIANNGHIVGTHVVQIDSVSRFSRAFIFRNGTLTNLEIPPGSLTTTARASNDSDAVVAISSGVGGFSQAYYWRNGGVTLINTLGGNLCDVRDLNNFGQAVGTARDAANRDHPYIWKAGVLTDLNTMIDPSSGWTITIPTAINNRGEVLATGVRNGQLHLILLTTRMQITRPRPGERWIAGEQDTIRWTAGRPNQFLNIEFSADRGTSYALSVLAIPADSGFYIWNLPDTLTTRAKLRFIDTATNDTLAECDTFKIKGYVLTRMTPGGHYETFKSNTHGWNYQNGSLWPRSWWSPQFAYTTAIDPYTNSSYPSFFHPIPDSTFVDWPLWVSVFSVDTSYRSTFFNSYRERAQQKWKSRGDVHKGSCFGFAASSFLAFNFKSQFLARNPGVPNFANLFSLPLNNAIRSTINGYFAHQFGIQSLNNDVIGQPKDPRTTLQEIKSMFIGDTTDIRTITIYNNPNGIFLNAGGAHTMAPISVTVDGSGPSRYRVNLYDSNNPGSNTPYILVDSLNNTWTDFTGLGPTWTGTQKFYLEIPVSNYLNTPIMGRPYSGSHDNIKGTGNIEFYNTSKANVLYTGSNGHRIGLVNGIVTDEIENGIAIFDKNGRPSDPVGYYIPDDNYFIVLSNMTDTTGKSYLSVFKDNVVYDYNRGNVNQSQVDRFNVNEGFSVSSQDPQEKHINLEVVAELDSSERIFFVRNTQLRQSDSLCMRELDQNKLVLKNYGSGKTYDLEIGQRSSSGQSVFEHLSIILQSNASHIVVPHWDSLSRSSVAIWVDLGNNGTIDDTLTIMNQTTGVDGRAPSDVPKEYNLAQNYPNPFNPSTRIEYALPTQSHVTIKIYSLLGQEVASLVDDEQPRGRHATEWNGTSTNGLAMSSGVYFYRIEARPLGGQSSFTSVKKMVLMK
jgi:probable HAF family extracellular repeat protein